MNFNELFQKMRELDESSSLQECPSTSMDDMYHAYPPATQKQMDSVTMNVNMNAAGAGGLRDLLNVLKDIQDGPDGGSTVHSFGMSTPRTDSMFSKDHKHDGGEFSDNDADVLIAKKPGMDVLTFDDYANEPDEEYSNIAAVTGTGDDLHSNRGDHRMRQTGLPQGRPTVESLKTVLNRMYSQIKEN